MRRSPRGSRGGLTSSRRCGAAIPEAAITNDLLRPEIASPYALAFEALDAAAAHFPDSPAIDFLGRRWSYGALGAAVRRVAAGLQALGVGKGDRVGLCLPNAPYGVIAYHAVLKAGAIVVNFNPLYVERELVHQLRDSGTSVLFVIDIADIHARAAAACAAAGVRTVVLCPLAGALPRGKAALYRLLRRRSQAKPPPPGTGVPHVDFAALAATREPFRSVALEAQDVAVLQYTGGTTGTPKGAMLSHANVVSNAEQCVAFDPTRQPGVERVLGVLPLFHVFAMTVVMNYAVRMAAEMVLLPRYEIGATLKALLRTRPTVFPAVPTIYGAIAAMAKARRRDLTFVRLCISGGAPLPREVGALFREVTGAQLVEGYGLTEASPVVACNPANGPVKYGSIGLPLAGTVIEARDPVTRELVGRGERGELVIRGPQVMLGYWGRPEETAATLDAHGLRTGDIGTIDEDGYIFIVDRIKDLILCSGYNVYPRAIEDALYRHPDVVEAIAIGVPDSYRGQSAKAFVVLREGSGATTLDLHRFLLDQLSKIERPREIEIRDALPKTAIGKLSRKELVAEEERRGASSAAGQEVAA